MDDKTITDEMIELKIKLEKEYYQNTLEGTIDVICQIMKVDRERVARIANKVYQANPPA